MRFNNVVKLCGVVSFLLSAVSCYIKFNVSKMLYLFKFFKKVNQCTTLLDEMKGMYIIMQEQQIDHKIITNATRGKVFVVTNTRCSS